VAEWPGSNGGGGGFDYVQPAQPSDAKVGEEWYDSDASEAKVYDGSTWHKMTVGQHAELGGVGVDDHHTPPSATTGAVVNYSSKSAGTQYTNNSGEVEIHHVRVDMNPAIDEYDKNASATVDGVGVAAYEVRPESNASYRQPSKLRVTMTFGVPPGSTYSVGLNKASLVAWTATRLGIS